MICAEPEPGVTYEGKITRIVDFGAFVEIMPGTEGLLHISQIAEERVEKVTDYLEEGQVIRVKCLDVDQRGRIKLSLKEALREAAEAAATESAAEPAVEESPKEDAPVAEVEETVVQEEQDTLMETAVDDVPAEPAEEKTEKS